VSIKVKFYDFLQNTLAKVIGNTTEDIKLIFDAELYFKVTDKGIDIGLSKKSYIAIYDKSQGKDILKKRTPITGHITFPTKGKIPIKYKAEFPKA
jgi:hypothetical protein